MKKLSIILIGITLLFLQSCIPSLHPFFLKKDLVKDHRIIGTWSSNETDTEPKFNTNWTFTDTDHDHYHLTFTENGNASKFDANLFKLDGQLYLDLYPQHDNSSMNTLLAMSAFPGHLLCKVVFRHNGIDIQLLDSEELEKLFKNHQIRLRHVKNKDGNIMLTASTEELRAFVIKYGKDEEFFTEGDFLKQKVISE